MKTILVPLLTTLVDLLRSLALLQFEMLALRQQLAIVASRDNKRLRSQPLGACILGLALSVMVRLPSYGGNLQARHCGPMASKRISTVLDMEISPALGWSKGRGRSSCRWPPSRVPTRRLTVCLAGQPDQYREECPRKRCSICVRE